LTVAAALSSDLAKMADLATVLSLEDLWDVLEVTAVNRHNEAILAREQRT